jgi:hypothetical protein
MVETVPISSDTNHAMSAIAVPEPPNRLRTSHIGISKEKIAVYREENIAPKTGVHVVVPDHGMHVRTDSNLKSHEGDWVPRAEEQNRVFIRRNENQHIPLRDSATRAANNTQLIQRLQSITTKRASLLRQLDSLQHEEAEVFALLARTTSEQLAIPGPPPPPSRPLDTHLPPVRALSASKLPRLKHSQTSRKRLPLRLVSVQPTSTPSRTWSDAPSTLERISLDDKTKETLKAGYAHV